MASLHTAIAAERVQQVRVLLDLNVDTTWTDEDGRSAIMKVALMESNERSKIIASMLFLHKLNYTVLDCYSRSALTYAAMSGRDYLVKECIGDAGVDLRRKDIYGHTCLMYAAMSGNSNCVRYLVQLYRTFGLTLDDRNPAGFTAYLLSVLYKNDACTDILKDEGGASKYVCDDQRFWDDKAWTEIATLVVQSVDTTLLQELSGNSKLKSKSVGMRRPQTAPGTLPNLNDSQYRILRAHKFVRLITMNFNRVNHENPMKTWNENSHGTSYKRKVVSSLSDYSTTKRLTSSHSPRRSSGPIYKNDNPLSDADVDVIARAWADNHLNFKCTKNVRNTSHLEDISHITLSKKNNLSTSVHLNTRPRTRKTSPNSVPLAAPSIYDNELQQKEIKRTSTAKSRVKLTQRSQSAPTLVNQKQELNVLFEQYSTVQLPVRKGFQLPDPPRIMLTPSPTLSRRSSRLMSITSVRKHRFSRSILSTTGDSVSISSRVGSL